MLRTSKHGALLALILLSTIATAFGEQTAPTIAPVQNNQPVSDDELRTSWEACTLHYEQPSFPTNTKGVVGRPQLTKFKAGWESCTAIGDEFAKRTDAVVEQRKKKDADDLVRRLKK